ncbi:MAG: chorismate mutase, partial [Planctomycetales bacterium]|nr:chorismate mutase [Planctomycetales bacterium]
MHCRTGIFGMAKKTSTTRTKRAAGSARRETPAELSRKIARLDRDLMQLINERAKLTVRLAKTADEGVDPRTLTATDLSTLENAVGGSKGPLDEAAVRAIYRELYSGARRLVQPTRVAYLGPAYSYSHQAAIERFGTSVDLTPVASIAAVFEEVNRGHAEYGLVPIENSTDGRIVDTLDMFARNPANICGEVQLRIHHNLLSRCQRGEVTEVYSKPQALSQCRDWLTKHLPFARLVEMTSTTAAAQLAADKYGAAAIASLQAAANYGLDVIASNIEDNRNNVTRFAVIGKEEPKRSGNDKT